MPKIFKQNKFALLGANILIIVIWVTLSSAVVDLFVSDNTKSCYHPGRSGSITLKSEKGPHLAYLTVV